MKPNRITKILSCLLMALLMSFASCTGDLNTSPIDPDVNTSERALQTESDFLSFLAECYAALAVSGSSGASSSNISGIDAGFGQYIRAYYYMNVLTTDEAVIGWNDGNLYNLHYMSWDADNEFVAAAYYRTMYQVSLCNEFVRQSGASSIVTSNMTLYTAEARALRALAYYHALDMFANVPFTTEEDAVGSIQPTQISRADLFEWLVAELKTIRPQLQSPLTADYGRADQSFADMLLSKLYLNAEVYTGTAMYDSCYVYSKKIADSGRSLVSNYENLFMADNNETSASEIIFPVEQDGLYTQSYGCTNFIIFAATGGTMPASTLMGISSGWYGLRTTPEFVDLFDSTDTRALFWTDGQTKDIATLSDFSNGYAVYKFRNVRSDGNAAQSTGFVDTDFPLFRLADVYLMIAECAKRMSAGDATEGLSYLNLVRNRAGLSSLVAYTLDEVLNERGRELYWEGHRRQDLIRFGVYTSSTKLWAWKGEAQAGVAVDGKYVLFPIPYSDIVANPNLTQNTGY